MTIDEQRRIEAIVTGMLLSNAVSYCLSHDIKCRECRPGLIQIRNHVPHRINLHTENSVVVRTSWG